MMNVSVVIPAFNEASRIASILSRAIQYADEVIVVDDGSNDGTDSVAEALGVRVVRQAKGGYVSAVKRGFREASGDVIVTIDADGEHCADDIPRLIAPIRTGMADLVLGRRPRIDRLSERVLNWLSKHRVSVGDTGTGFRAYRRELALRQNFEGRCICGCSVLEAAALGARIAEVPVRLDLIDKRRRIAWWHILQVYYVTKWLLRCRNGIESDVAEAYYGAD
jgi:glycosyltransferase involved in cell wall biosynthesis